jgi:hypothetical protein
MKPQLRHSPSPIRPNGEANLRRLNRALANVSRRLNRHLLFQRAYRSVGLALITGLALGAAYVVVATLSPWPPMALLKHVISSYNCEAAREMGLAPARKSEPGYWRKNDVDADGIACEPWPHLDDFLSPLP